MIADVCLLYQPCAPVYLSISTLIVPSRVALAKYNIDPVLSIPLHHLLQ